VKPKDLKCPFTWESRRPLICDHVLYVPEYYDRHGEYIFPGWSSPEVFGRDCPIEIEYCSGNGAWIVEKALAHPERNWVAVELQFDRARKIWSKVHNFELNNLLVVCGEALTFLLHYVKEAVFAAAYVNFPDPWPKEKHAKNRLLQEPFFNELSRTCLPGAILTVATDHRGYALSTIENLQGSSSWSACHPSPHYITEYPDYGTSYFEALWREKGIGVHYIQYSNQERR
jgi:tRNA (guanine-N7-)-methyltransferase